MKLVTFGDSWTEGVGSDIITEKLDISLEEKTKIRHRYSWPSILSNFIEIDHINFGIGGCSNKVIFEAVCNSIDNGTLQSNDFVVIMWSSSLRDDVPFFPNNNNWHYWGERYKTKSYLYQKVFDNQSNLNEKYKRIKKDYQEYFLMNLYSNEYYEIVNRNYILYLQFMFKKIGIRYLFCDAFDLMIHKNVDKIELIDKNHYWNLSKKTFKDFLVSTNRMDVWSDNNFWDDTTIGKHPNKNGYKLIANEIYDYIIKYNLLTYDLQNLENNII